MATNIFHELNMMWEDVSCVLTPCIWNMMARNTSWISVLISGSYTRTYPQVAVGDMTTAYRCGKLIDLCRGPHIPSMGRVKVAMSCKTMPHLQYASAPRNQTSKQMT